ncbi:sensor histidine kinase [Sphingomonas sp. FW199]|uniref:sensor histidine kinase n=1 Tax=Sphingomonas sp. FW199 TaxID=3400217 RepID=UPI003CF9AC8F
MADTHSPVLARLDPQGCLVEGDARLLDLNTAAGGALGKPLSLPELSTLASLALRLRVPIARTIDLADGDIDLRMAVRLVPDEQGVRIEGGRWQAAMPPAPTDTATVAWGLGAAGSAGSWAVDGALRLTRIGADLTAPEPDDAAHLLGAPVTQLFRLEPDNDGGLPMLAGVAAVAAFSGQRAVLRATGQAMLLSGRPLTDAVGRFAGIEGVAEPVPDIAEQVPEADAAASPLAIAERLERALRVPLRRIIANADSIGEQSDGPIRSEYAAYARDIATAGRHLIGLVEDLAQVQTIDSPDFQLVVEPVDLAELGRRAAGLLSVRAEAGQVRIDAPTPGDRVDALGDYRRVLQILVNLIGNAVRYSPPGASVWVRLERDGPNACVIVADQGKGIAIEDQARIFEKFERVDPAEPGGSGLGLYIARRLARAMGGDIVVDSAPGQGARFMLTLRAA